MILAVDYSYSVQEQNKEERGITSEKDRREKLLHQEHPRVRE